MRSIKANDYENVLKTIHEWPASQRIILLQDVLKTLTAGVERTGPRKATLDEALGLLATDGLAPSDDDIQRWLHERRMEKFA